MVHLIINIMYYTGMVSSSGEDADDSNDKKLAVCIEVCRRLKDHSLLEKAQIHPFNVLLALKTYEQGRGDKGKLTWKPIQPLYQV